MHGLTLHSERGGARDSRELEKRYWACRISNRGARICASRPARAALSNSQCGRSRNRPRSAALTSLSFTTPVKRDCYAQSTPDSGRAVGRRRRLALGCADSPLKLVQALLRHALLPSGQLARLDGALRAVGDLHAQTVGVSLAERAASRLSANQTHAVAESVERRVDVTAESLTCAMHGLKDSPDARAEGSTGGGSGRAVRGRHGGRRVGRSVRSHRRMTRRRGRSVGGGGGWSRGGGGRGRGGQRRVERGRVSTVSESGHLQAALLRSVLSGSAPLTCRAVQPLRRRSGTRSLRDAAPREGGSQVNAESSQDPRCTMRELYAPVVLLIDACCVVRGESG